MPELAKHIEVVINDKGTQRLLIEDREFPWHVTEAGPTVTIPRVGTDLPTANVTLLAEKIEVRDERGSVGGRQDSQSVSLEATFDQLQHDHALTKQALKASQATVCGLAQDLSEAQHRARKAEARLAEGADNSRKVGTAYIEVKPDLSALRDLLAPPSQEATCTCDGVNSGCSHPACPSRGE